MSEFFKKFKINASPTAKKTHTLIRKGVRITVLSPCLVRVENQKYNHFCDEPTQTVLFRDFSQPVFHINESRNTLEIKTTKAKFVYSVSSGKMVKIKLLDGRTVTNFKSGNLKGTCRTLDVGAGLPFIGDGIISKNGVAVLDDSDTLVLKDNGKILPREHSEKDVYYFAYGYDYTGAVKDFYSLTGKTPLIPRYALSNWWSRYKAYTQDEYLELMKRFKKEEIPVCVATVDMDWHWVDVKKKFGYELKKPLLHKNALEYFYDVTFPGWTGYSFNTDLFPDPDLFLKTLKDENYKITFNIHPSQGVRPFEDCYAEMCRGMGQNPENKKVIPFDITDEKFTENYFKVLHYPLENKGVDFWWIDWQQGTKSRVPGLDPLWALNHYHYIDNSKNGKRPLILSRFAGAGSQRYPLGFSGDTVQNWKSLEFQPYFTATASNIGYPWWSHDIGGHCMGKKDDELYLRWIQFGVFSPVMRLHSTANEFMGKEPWKYSGAVERIAKQNLKLRHKLLPYIYTMNKRTHTEGRAICEPMYYNYPKNEEAYAVKNEYFFGTELIVIPVTEHTSKETNMASAQAWIPSGRYTDIFTGRIYSGQRFLKLYRDTENIPVLAKEGAIIPLSVNDTVNDYKNPEDMEILIYRGNNSFKLYEDDGETNEYENGVFCETEFTVKEDGTTLLFTMEKVSGDTSVISAKRNFTLKFRDVVSGTVSVKINGKEKQAETTGENGTVCVYLKNIKVTDKAEIEITTCDYLVNVNKKDALTEVISKYQMSNDRKGRLFNDFVLKEKPLPLLSEDLQGPLLEILSLYRG